LAQCKLDADRTRCVPPTTTTTTTTSTTTTTLPPGRLVAPTHPSPIALATNDAFLVNVNPEADTISVFSVLPEPAKLAEVAVGGDPSSVAIHPDSVTAYVTNARDGTVSVVDLTSRTADTPIDVGAEPSGVAISPNGTRLYVANSASNSLQVIDTASRSVLDTIDLSAFGSAPRAVAVTNDGDDDDQDETIFVALFFAQLRPGKPAAQE